MKWTYKLQSGVALREAIHSEDLNKVLDAIMNCWRELLDEGYITEQDYYNSETDIEDLRDTVMNYEEYELHYTDVEQEVDYELDNLYDFCDEEGIWVEI